MGHFTRLSGLLTGVAGSILLTGAGPTITTVAHPITLGKFFEGATHLNHLLTGTDAGGCEWSAGKPKQEVPDKGANEFFIQLSRMKGWPLAVSPAKDESDEKPMFSALSQSTPGDCVQGFFGTALEFEASGKEVKWTVAVPSHYFESGSMLPKKPKYWIMVATDASTGKRRAFCFKPRDYYRALDIARKKYPALNECEF